MAYVKYARYVFEPPAGWQDRTVAAFFAPPAPGEAIAPNVVITSEPRRDGDKLATHVQRQLLMLAAALEGFDVLESEEVTVAGRRALQTRCVWKVEQTTIEQTMVHLEPDREDATVTTLTCTSTVEAATGIWPIFERLVATLQPAPQRNSSAPPASAKVAGWGKP
jgi:hypothetical protein